MKLFLANKISLFQIDNQISKNMIYFVLNFLLLILDHFFKSQTVIGSIEHDVIIFFRKFNWNESDSIWQGILWVHFKIALKVFNWWLIESSLIVFHFLCLGLMHESLRETNGWGFLARTISWVNMIVVLIVFFFPEAIILLPNWAANHVHLFDSIFIEIIFDKGVDDAVVFETLVFLIKRLISIDNELDNKLQFSVLFLS